MIDPSKFFTKPSNIRPYLSMGLQGFPGAGKTTTAALIAIGLHKHIGSKKPIVLYDSEKSFAKFLGKLFDRHGIEVFLKESQTFADLALSMQACRDGLSDIFLADSLTHPWVDIVDSFKRKKNRGYLKMDEWGTVKGMWRAGFSAPLVDGAYHKICTGRAGYNYDEETDEETGKDKLVKTGVKMKSETETAYEFDFLIHMERGEELLDKTSERKVWREAMVLKGRGEPGEASNFDGRIFRNPKFDDFEPMVRYVLDGTAGVAGPEPTDTASLIVTEEDRRVWLRRREIALEEIEAELTSKWPSTSGKEKQAKIAALKYAFETPSWTAIQALRTEDVEKGLDLVRKFVAEQPAELKAV